MDWELLTSLCPPPGTTSVAALPTSARPWDHSLTARFLADGPGRKPLAWHGGGALVPKSGCF